MQKCIKHLNNQTLLPQKLIIVDNSDDGSHLSTEISEFSVVPVQYINPGMNTGYARANNMAVKEVTSEYFALLNPDAFPAQDWLEKLFSATLTNPDFSVYASCLFKDEDFTVLDGAGDEYHVSGIAWRRYWGKKADSVILKPEPVFSACAAAALYRTKDFREVGGFDESFFCYFEDVDFSFRMNLQGCFTFFVPESRVHHIGAASSGYESSFMLYNGHRNLEWTFFRNMPLLILILSLPVHIMMIFYSLIYYGFRGKFRVLIKSKIAALSQLLKYLKQRKQISKKRKISCFRFLHLLNWGYPNPFGKANPLKNINGKRESVK